jgi:uncharacterized protein with HEPN domain
LKREYRLYLEDILEAINHIQDYTENKSIQDFRTDSLVVDAVLRNLEIIGEAATQVPDELRKKHKEVPWRDIQDFRIVVAHKYWKINLDRI